MEQPDDLEDLLYRARNIKSDEELLQVAEDIKKAFPEDKARGFIYDMTQLWKIRSGSV